MHPVYKFLKKYTEDCKYYKKQHQKFNTQITTFFFKQTVDKKPMLNGQHKMVNRNLLVAFAKFNVKQY